MFVIRILPPPHVSSSLADGTCAECPGWHTSHVCILASGAPRGQPRASPGIPKGAVEAQRLICHRFWSNVIPGMWCPDDPGRESLVWDGQASAVWQGPYYTTKAEGRPTLRHALDRLPTHNLMDACLPTRTPSEFTTLSRLLGEGRTEAKPSMPSMFPVVF